MLSDYAERGNNRLEKGAGRRQKREVGCVVYEEVREHQDAHATLRNRNGDAAIPERCLGTWEVGRQSRMRWNVHAEMRNTSWY
ncbi:hypothetical protein CBOM_07483 [Ceraceosorus bombacis]|uniref:Uncharacterized protein n=1 Tax=Ceraceosorus bombacis TaxID=401625 RepID=A0A0P1BDH6_9BASI|nr:hypothetical protein CBOM_07483 [Ceraceosorus bombacis]